MIGGKSVAAVGFAAVAAPAAVLRGRLDLDYLHGLSAASAIAIGVFAGACGALLMAAWRPHVKSVVGLGAGAVRELPSAVQRTLVTAGLACIGLAVFANPTTARLVGLPAALAEPSKSAYCPPPPPEEEEAPPPVVVEVPEQPGCALVKRAFELGYAKSLGSCAPQKIEQHVEEVKAAIAPCDRRKLDEPFLHFAWRRMTEQGGNVGDVDPVSAVSHRVDDMQTKVDHIDVLVGRLLHAVGGSPHAAHHIWINLPDPRPGSWSDSIDPPRCDERYTEIDAWPDAPSPSALVENVLGNLLFSTRFGKPPASCRDVQVHWNAPADACARLIADPSRAPGVHDVLDRRQKQLDARALADLLGEETAIPEPPAAGTVVSLSCFVVDPTGPATPTTSVITIDHEPLEVREVRVASIATDGAGPIAVYTALAELLATGAYSGPAADTDPLSRSPSSPSDLSGTDMLLTRLDTLQDADPFLGTTWPLSRPDLRDVYPFHRHLYAFIDAFRRRYLAARGRL